MDCLQCSVLAQKNSNGVNKCIEDTTQSSVELHQWYRNFQVESLSLCLGIPDEIKVAMITVEETMILETK